MKNTCQSFCIMFIAATLGALCIPFSFSLASVLGDRLVVSINDVPYTQRQVEAYITVKESLRQTNNGSVRTVDTNNWTDALQVFSEDMIVLQEAQRLGSFSSADQLFEKYANVVRGKIGRGGALHDTLARLGVNDQDMEHTLESVLRVAAFRHSKDKQEVQGIARTAAKKTGASGKWLNELVDRAIVRQFDGALRYEAIEPTAGTAHGR